ncbi:MAG TPA: S8 family serine peptidase [Micromonosporaceae bacterium]
MAALAVAVLGSIAPVASAAQPPDPKPKFKELPRPERPRGEKKASYDQHSVLVRFKPGASATAKDGALKSRGARTAGAVRGTAFVKVRTTRAAAELLRDLRKDPAVQSVSLDYRRRVTAAPNDEYYTYGDQKYLNTVRLPQAWDRTKGSTSQVIAIADTGVDTAHPDLVGRIVAGYNAISPGSAPADDNGHGTMVAGIAAANTNNGIGVAGVAWTGRVMPVKVLDRNGFGFDSDVAEGVTWAADHGAKIVNLSLGGPTDSPALHDAMKYAVGKGAVVVVAAGNEGDDTPQYPAAYPEVLAVGATDTAGNLTDFSSSGDWIDVAAPGFGIVSTYPKAFSGTYPPYAIGDGTSLSAPIASGVAALVRTMYPTLTPAQVMGRLRATARDAGPRGIDPYYGYGVLDAYSAVGGGWGAEFPQRAMGIGEPNDVPARATVLSTSVTGTIGMEGDVDWYRYESTEQRSVEVRATPPTYDVNRAQNLDPVVAVYDKDLRLLGEVDKAGPGSGETVWLTMNAGTHYVAVRNYNGAADTRSYTLAVAPAGLYAPAETRPVGGSAFGVAVGDMTGDGRNDVVFTTRDYNDPANDNKLFVFAQKADRSLASPVRYNTQLGPNDSAAVALLDATGDGRLDAALATRSGIEIFQQTAAGVLESTGVIPGTENAWALTTADIDGDRDADLVAATNPAGIAVLTQESPGTFVSSPVSSDATYELEVGDVDGDGRMDVVAYYQGLVRVYHHREAGWERTEHAAITGYSPNISGIEVADLTGDGRADVAATIGGNGASRINVFVQTPTGELNAPVVYPTADLPGMIEAADINGDGRSDLVTPSDAGPYMSTLLQAGDGTLSTPVLHDVPYGSVHLALGDINGDDRPDVVLSNRYQGLVVVPNITGPPPAGEQVWVRNISPANFATAVALGTAPTVSFARPVDPASVTAASVRLASGRSGATVAATVSYDAASRTATIRPAAALQDNTPYRVVVAGVRDSAGVAQVGKFTTTFRTVDVVPPAVGNLKATGGHGTATLSWTLPQITDLDQVIVRMAAGTVAPSSPTSGTGVYAGTSSGATVSGLAAGTTYTFRVWVRDRSGKYSSTAPSVRLVGTRATISSNTTAVTYGGAVTVTGRLVRADTGAAIAGVPVQLYGRRKGTTSWMLLGAPSSSSSGYLTFSHKPSWSLDYLWVYRGSTVFMGTGSPLRAVGVRPVVTANLSRTSVALGGSVTLSGGVAPGHAGHRVYLQQFSSGAWATVNSQLLPSTSTYAFAIKPGYRGTYYYRVYKPADPDHLAAISPTRSFSVY